MKKVLMLFLCVAFVINATAQLKIDTERTAIFIKVWGFLKYYHPAVARGTMDWDSVFIHQLGRVLSSKGDNDFNNVVEEMMRLPYNDSPITKSPEEADLFLANRPDVKWVSQTKLLSVKNKQKIESIFENPNRGNNRFIKHHFQTLDFSVENSFENMTDPDYKYRLLFLSRYWNIINYLAPYKYLVSDWDKVLNEFIEKMANTSDRVDYYKALYELTARTRDGHSFVASTGKDNPDDMVFGRFKAPFYCSIAENRVIVRKGPEDSLKQISDIRRGDEILAVDGRTVKDLIREKSRYVHASNQEARMHFLSRIMLDGNNADCILQIRRDGLSRTVNIRRSDSPNRNWVDVFNHTASRDGFPILKDSILHIFAGQIWDARVDTIKQLINRSKAVIFDVRNYPNNDAIYSVIDPFLSEPKNIDRSTVLSKIDPGIFAWKLNPNKIGHQNSSPYQGKVIILCDERTQSQGEYTCMALQTIPGAITIGRQTAGADGMVVHVPIGGGLSLTYSGYGVYYPDKRPTQQVGIHIDIHVKPSVEAIQQGRDEILERAMRYLNHK